MKKNNQPGYILVLTLILISLTVLIVSKLAQQSGIQRSYTATMHDRQAAQQLALSGIEIAKAQLTYKKQDEKKKEDKNLLLLRSILPHLNVWQTFPLEEGVDDFEGEVGLSIVAEEGKIDINSLYNYAEQTFVSPQVKKTVQKLFEAIAKQTNGAKLFEDFENFLKKREYKIEDVTELMTIPSFSKEFSTTLFYDPPNSQDKDQKRPIYLADLFTVHGEEPQLSAWLLSDSVLALLGLNRAEKHASQSQKKEVQEIGARIKTVSGDLKKLWHEHLLKLYGKDLTALPKELQSAVSPGLFFKNFTVVSYGRVRQTMQIVIALLERVDENQFIIKRLYWK